MTRSLRARLSPQSLERLPSAAESRLGSVKLHIEELVVHGMAPGNREQIGQSIQGELTRLLVERGVPAALTRPHAIECLRCGALHSALSSRSEMLGAQIAKAVYGGLK
jgi:hypothetical protein